jgi:hypothetical protein
MEKRVPFWQVAIVTLRPGAVPADLRAKELSVVLSNR